MTTTSTLPRLPLRITLVVLIVALVGVALTATGFAATRMLQGYLADQQEDELRQVLDEAQASRVVLDACLDGVDRDIPNRYFVGCLAPDTDVVTVVYAPPPRAGALPDVADEVERSHDGRHTMWSRDGEWQMATRDVGSGYTLVAAGDLGRDERVIGRLVAIEVVVGLIVLTVLGAAAYLLVRNSLRPLTEVERTAAAIAAGDLSQRVPAGDDRTEVGRLATALNGMLSRIEHGFRAQQASEEQARASENRMRRFVADASHELRTPLTSIRGFAELYRQGAVRSDEDVTRLM